MQDQHTLREYNIQKPSVLTCLGPLNRGRLLEAFVSGVQPARDSTGVPVSASVRVHFVAAQACEGFFWGQMLGGPDLSTVVDALVCICICISIYLYIYISMYLYIYISIYLYIYISIYLYIY